MADRTRVPRTPSAVTRAVVVIGVARTGGRFPELSAVPGAVAAVQSWARAQGVPDDLVLTFADADGSPVTAGAVLTGVRTLVDRGDVEQLVVYFSGHGINTGNSEFWLLSGAPEDGSQAVNVSLTSWYGERLPVRHVVLVSDACRTAASTTQELSIQGTAIVPNLPPSGPAASVDVFYACALGDPAYEVKDPAAAGAAYRALYTTVLVEALRGEYADLVTAGTAPGLGLVQPWPLKRALPGLVAARLTATRAPLDLNQTPDARLSSDPQVAWLSRLEPWPRAEGGVARGGAEAGAEVFRPAPDVAPSDRRVLGQAASPRTASPRPAPPRPAPGGRPDARAAAVRAAGRLAEGYASTAVAVPAPAPTEDTGLEVALAVAPRVVVHGDEVLTAEQVTAGAAVVTFGSGGCAVLPVLPGRVTLAIVEDGRLVDCAMVTANPSGALGTWGASATSGGSGTGAISGTGGTSGTGGSALGRRAVTATYSRFGLSPDDDEDDDPSSAALDADPLSGVYLAWTLHDRGRRTELRELVRPGAATERLFDVVLLAGEPGAAGDTGRWDHLLTPVPLLARGWALLPAAPERVRDRARGFPPRLPSHWTLFAAADAARVTAALLDTEESP